jgi:hypothetical protein
MNVDGRLIRQTELAGAQEHAKSPLPGNAATITQLRDEAVAGGVSQMNAAMCTYNVCFRFMYVHPHVHSHTCKCVDVFEVTT